MYKEKFVSTFICSYFNRLPVLRTDGKFKLNGTIVNILPLNGNGNMYVELRNFKIVILGELFINTNGFAKITNLNLDATFESSNLHLENLLVIERGLGEQINKIIPKMAPNIWNAMSNQVLDILSDAIKKIVNKELGKCSITDRIARKC